MSAALLVGSWIRGRPEVKDETQKAGGANDGVRPSLLVSQRIPK